ncbi:hypothetical protein [Rhodococcoides kroppenstedtii]|uniref:hypothetical protein n=1 Tax=Rhodococcoides kroppenstedtii TaxID=293050 RepID=UPI0028E656BF|nr:hypothetical protein [Rhodococcus kroppenstedtii]
MAGVGGAEDGASFGDGDRADDAAGVVGVGVLVVDEVAERFQQVVEPAFRAEAGRAGLSAPLGDVVVVFGDVVEVAVPRWSGAAGPGAVLVSGADVGVQRR